ncbi:class A beta-lactamase [Microbacterium sp. JB110]|uniref:class A beta-lactamase n=1 Tax=Microbacterium sp. JB110 TaxID=2024477 RepID=UPI000B35336D|nr:class A beta-lactamase [Microbacterium sp. JB110]RCS62689.1 class A beta-lactamase [Microbacterium sp. JB110]
MRSRTRLLLLVSAVALPFLAGCGASVPDAPAPTSSPSQESAPPQVIVVDEELAPIEEEFHARVGVSVLDTGTGATIDYRSEERFGFASTLKVFAVAEMLRQVAPEQRDELVTWTEETVADAGYSPITAEHVADGLTLAQLAEAALRDSDNAATNLILDRIGGVEGMQAGLKRLGDSTTDVSDVEPELNEVVPGDTGNTTTPAAFTADLSALLRPEHLEPADRATLLEWMSGNATGDALIRAGAPADWAVADKSGGAGAMRNDIAVVTAPGRDPIIVTILTEKNDPDAAYEDEIVARVAEVVLAASNGDRS